MKKHHPTLINMLDLEEEQRLLDLADERRLAADPRVQKSIAQAKAGQTVSLKDAAEFLEAMPDIPANKGTLEN